MLEKFRDYMNNHVALSPEEWALISSKFQSATFLKGELINKMGDIHDKIYFINSGLVRAYTLDGEGKDFTWSIYFNDDNSHVVNLFVVDYESFTTKMPSRLEIEALEESEFVYLKAEDIETLSLHSHNMLLFCKTMSDMAYCYLHHRVLDWQSKSAAERFEDFVEQTPHLLEKVPQYQIASYLGMTPIHLSRLKKGYQR